jgi:hypothetical protein
MNLLNEIQQKLKVPKGQFNAFAKYNYRNAEDILEAVKPLLGDGTLRLDDELVQIGDRYYVKATAWLTDGSAENTWGAAGYAREEAEKKGMDAAQITGAASSYARKYALNGLFCIDDTKDADNHDNTKPQILAAAQAAAKTPSKPRPTEAEQRITAKKERIIHLLAVLGEPNDTKEEIVEAVHRLTNLVLEESNFDAIGDALSNQAYNTNPLK